MSYTHQMTFHLVANRVDLATDSTYLLTPGYQPITLRAVAAVITTTLAVAAITITITKRILVGSDAGAVAVGTLTIPSLTAAGKVVFKDGMEVKVMPGEELKFLVGGTGTGNGDIIATVEPSWEVPGNVAAMIESLT